MDIHARREEHIGMDITHWRETVGQHVEAQRRRRGLSKAAAARLAGTSDTWWRSLESGKVVTPDGNEQPFSPSAEKLAAASHALGWMSDGIERLRNGEPPLERTTDAAGVDQMLAAILGEIRNHRAADVAPGLRLENMPTTADVNAMVARAVSTVFESTNDRHQQLVSAIAALTAAVEANDERLAALEVPQSAPVTDPTPSKRSRQTRNPRSASTPRKD
jgi:transcriptional regulator with XRE-family HTH domain